MVFGNLISLVFPPLTGIFGSLAALGALALLCSIEIVLFAPIALVIRRHSRAILEARVLDSGRIQFVSNQGCSDVSPQDVRRIVRVLLTSDRRAYDDPPAWTMPPGHLPPPHEPPLRVNGWSSTSDGGRVDHWHIRRYTVEHAGGSVEIRSSFQNVTALVDWLHNQNPNIQLDTEREYEPDSVPAG
jgi:hypothetical protein